MYNINMTHPLVSAIIPVYDTGASALLLANDLLRGDYDNLEILLVNDGSTDDSFKLLKTLKDPKVKVFHQSNGGVSSARNLGLAKAKGDLVVFPDSDDRVASDFVSKLVKEIEKPDTSLVASGVHYHKLAKNSEEDVYLDAFPQKPHEPLSTFVLRSLLHDGRMYATFNKIFRADVIREHQLRFDEKLKFAEDTKFVLDYLCFAEGKIRFVPKPLYIYYAGTPTSAAKTLGLTWQNWQRSYQNLTAWVSDLGQMSVENRLLLLRVRAHWRLSWLHMNLLARKGKQ